MTKIRVAAIVAPHGLQGAVKVQTEDENPQRFPKGRQLQTQRSDQTLTVSRFQARGRMGILSFEEIETVEAAEALRGEWLMVEESELPSPGPDRYYVKDLIGLNVVDQQGHVFGRVKEVWNYPVNDVYVVETPTGKEVLVPAIRSIIQEIDLPSGCMVIAPMKGLFDED